jgi:hypothetical protein
MAAAMQNAPVAWDRAAAGWDGNAALIRAGLTEANAAKQSHPSRRRHRRVGNRHS